MTNIQPTPRPRMHAQPTRSRLRPLAAALALLAPALAFSQGISHVVNTCSDFPTLPDCSAGDDGTLRHALGCAQDGDIVDMTQLQCSAITLAAPLITGPVSVNINGPGASNLTISAGNQFRALVHNGRPGDTIGISGLTLRNGSYDNPYTYLGGGGCIFSSGNVYLIGTSVASCYTSAAGTIATGGAIFAKGTVTLAGSTVTGSTATGFADRKYATARGGGIYADTVNLYGSVVSGNTAASPTETTYGGGIYARHFTAKYSTIAGNNATSRAGVAAHESFLLKNSTISSNSARDFDGGAHLVSGTAYLRNSTIAFNSAGPSSTGGISGFALNLESTIIARNTAGGVESDVGTVTGGVTGTHNLIMASNVAPPGDTIADDPRLGPLLDNGGPSPTHALPADSPAIDHGSNPDGVEYDQRFEMRQTSKAPDIGAFELDRIFAYGFETATIEIER